MESILERFRSLPLSFSLKWRAKTSSSQPMVVHVEEGISRSELKALPIVLSFFLIMFFFLVIILCVIASPVLCMVSAAIGGRCMRALWALTDVFSIALGRSHPNVARVTQSGRYARQMGYRYGPAWHQVGFSRAVVAKETTSVGKAAGTPPVQQNTLLTPTTSNEIRTRAVELGLVSEEAHSSFSELCGKGTSTSKDPLLEFLEKNEEDAPILLAMWTSLRRCCLHASEISESLSLTTRWFLHHLIRMRAIAAAVQFYQRLLALGVQLQKWDVVLLLSNLPYDRSTTVADSQMDAWMRERRLSRGAELRQREKRRRGEDTTLTPPKGVVTPAGCEGVGKNEGERQGTSARVVTSNTAVPSQPTNSGLGVTAIKRTSNETDNNVLNSVNQLHSQHQGWVRQWLLYEASMGNIEFPDSEESVPIKYDGKLDASHFADAVEVDGDMLQDSLEANRLMGVITHLKHLMLLQDASILVETTKTGKSQKSPIKVDGGKSAIRHRRYWVEALHLSSVYMESILATRRVTSLPDELLEITRRAVMCSQSWKVSFHYLKLAKRYGVALSKEDYAKFVLMAAEEEPWRKNPAIEECMAHHIVPHIISKSTAAGYAVQAIWLVYACTMKLDRPEKYVELLGSHAVNLPTAIKEAIMLAKLAASHLQIEVDRYRAEVAAQELLATSLRKGLFSTVNETTPENSTSLLKNPTEQPATALLVGAVLSEWLIDSFVLVCISLPRVIALASILVVSQEDAVQLTSFLVDVLYSRMGVWGTFSKLYLGEANVSARRAPERSSVAAYMALCVFRVALALCTAHGEFASRRRGVALLTPKQLTLFLGMGTEALSAIPSYAYKSVELRSVMARLVRTAVRLTKEMCRLFNLTPSSEKLLFGVTSEETVESLVLMVRILLLLHTDAPRRHFPVSTQFFLRSLFRPNVGLGKQVRHSLRQKEVRQLDALLYRQAHSRTNDDDDDVSPSTQRLQIFSPEDVARIEATAKMHRSIYSVVVHHEGDSSAVEDALSSRLHSMKSDDAFLLLHVTLHHLRLRPGTFGMPFFVNVLERLRGGATGATDGSSLWLKAISVYWDAVEHTAAHSGSLSTAKASDRRGFQKHERNVLSELLLPMMQLSMSIRRRDLGWVWLDRWASLYTPVERDTCWAIRNVQARSTLHDKHALHMCLKLVLNEQQKVVVPEGVHVEPPSASFTSLLCEVAVKHADWREALDSLLRPFINFASCRSSITPLPSIVACSALRILCRAPVNLSNTALRLREIQGDQWDLQSANGLLLLLVRQRRWKLALQHVKEMCPLLDGVTDTPAGGANSYSPSNIHEKRIKDEKQLKMNQAFFLLYGLRACAIGGCGEEAALLYDRVKLLLTEACTGSALEKTATSGSAAHLEELLFSTLDPDEVVANVSSVGDENDQLHIIVGQARRYFLRAMTKKSLVTQGLHK
ncbi:hypothetical protein TraAM80_02461 [Trypanosoma rangeli]|uniref:Uncharacterized protein n=1 Tax=Trypanosoma rangeli TaxID=5698 RepID=A0A422NTX9_TRYRA|nr:uncharacterized protein TraAM80_02461 [Trypanosoma rangeli]RNF08915.1 hypothetical protein TraAM80_02461 [Trypanosoma rangeli]|eukprot:RNF08915.1 hypothetical protein TraAM80_02461 [Trypanosoma rangeli]